MARRFVKKDLSQGWLMTFTDMLMLLVVMFVLFLSFSEINSDSFKQNAGAISEAFNQPAPSSILPGYASITELSKTNINSHTLGPKAGIQADVPNAKQNIGTDRKKENSVKERNRAKATQVIDIESKKNFSSKRKDQVEKEIKLRESVYSRSAMSLKTKISDQLGKDIKDGNMQLIKKDRLVILRFPERVTFAIGSATLNQNIKNVMNRVRGVVRDSSGIKKIIVAGHTDSIPISNYWFRSNWELSAARAVSVVHSLLGNADIDKNMVMAVGLADTEPVLPNTSSENRALNRRVEIKIEF